MSREKQIEEMAKVLCCACTPDGDCSEDGKKCDLDCWAYVEGKQLYNAGYRKQAWISVDERLPEKNGYYLVYTNYGFTESDWYITWDDDDLDGGCWWELEGLVTHWMPLPEAPKKGGAE